jgi:hypothetical protein
MTLTCSLVYKGRPVGLATDGRGKSESQFGHHEETQRSESAAFTVAGSQSQMIGDNIRTSYPRNIPL